MVVVLALSSLFAGCGSRQPHDEIVRAWGDGPTAGNESALASEVTPSDGSGTVPSGGEELSGGSGTVDTGAGSTAGATGLGSTGAVSAPSGSGSGKQGAGPAAGSGSAGPTSAAPGQNSSTPAPGQPAAGGGSGAAVQKGSGDVVIGSVSTLSGPVGGTLASGPRAVQAWVAAVNAKGGVNGRRIKMLMADDGADPARHKALVQQFVEGSGVIAFVHMEAPLSGQSAVAYLEQKKIPVIGTEGGNNWANQSPMYFPQNPSGDFLATVFARATAQVALAVNRKKVAVWVCEFANCNVAVKAEEFRKAGMTVVHEGRDSITQPDYTAECLQTRNAGAEVMFVMMTPDGMHRLTESCKSIGYRPMYGQVGMAMAPSFTKNPELDGSVYGVPTAPFFDEANPAIVAFRTAMQQHAPGVAIDGTAVTGWVSAKLFERALATSQSASPGSADILKGLWSVKNDDLDGLTSPLTFSEGAANNSKDYRVCWWPVTIKSGAWASANGGKRECL
jgi:branched-chain amino acid transport system substrate-binding protein